MTLKELAVEYRKSEAALDNRIRQLKKQIKASDQPHEITSLRHRIAVLDSMRRDAQSLAATCEHYYDRGYHRNELFKV